MNVDRMTFIIPGVIVQEPALSISHDENRTGFADYLSRGSV